MTTHIAPPQPQPTSPCACNHSDNLHEFGTGRCVAIGCKCGKMVAKGTTAPPPNACTLHDLSALHAALKRAFQFTTPDVHREAIRCVRLEPRNRRIVATDGHCLYIGVVPDACLPDLSETVDQGWGLLLSRDVLLFLDAGVEASATTVDVTGDDLRCGPYHLPCSGERFPDYARVIPSTMSLAVFEVELADVRGSASRFGERCRPWSCGELFLAAIERKKLPPLGIVTGKAGDARIILHPQHLPVCEAKIRHRAPSEDSDDAFAHDVSMSMDVDEAKENPGCLLKLGYVLRAFGRCKRATVRLDLDDAMAPVSVTAGDETHYIMPMRR